MLVAFDHVEVEDGAVAGGEAVEEFEDVGFGQAGGGLGGYGEGGGVDVGQFARLLQGVLFAQQHQGFVDDDAADPAFETTVVRKGADLVEDLVEGGDEHIFGVGVPGGVAAGHGEHRGAVAVVDGALGAAVVGLTSADELLLGHGGGYGGGGGLGGGPTTA